jgi:hypothetical protein
MSKLLRWNPHPYTYTTCKTCPNELEKILGVNKYLEKNIQIVCYAQIKNPFLFGMKKSIS